MQTFFRLALLLLFAILSTREVCAQITDDFSDGDFLQNPAWTGDVSNFIVEGTGQLQLNAPDAGTSILVVQGNIPDSAVWQIDILMEFAPSAANLLRVYLLADQADLNIANGYFLEIGENGSADAIRMFRQDAGVKTLLATGTPGLVANEPVAGKIRMRKNTAGDWTLEAQPQGSAFQLEFTVNDATYPGGENRWFGLQCVYSPTRKDKFFFDNLNIQPDLPDTTPPVLLNAQATSDTTIEAAFSEALDPVSASLASNFSISTVGQPVSAGLAPGNNSVARIVLAQPLPQSGAYQLTASQVADLAGNTSASQTVDFQFIKIETAANFDLVINEIMADPSPVVGLPDLEWAEIFNRSGKYVNLQTLTFGESGGVVATLPNYVLPPDSIVVLCATSSAAALSAITPNVLALSSFPSLNNASDWLILARTDGEVINQVVYEAAWHTDPDKAEGGWTLERINPNLPCLGAANWMSSTDPAGGTPGRRNSGFSDTPDTIRPQLLDVTSMGPNTLRLQFSEGLDETTIGQLDQYVINPSIVVTAAFFPGGDRSLIEITLGTPLISGVSYNITIGAELTDCSGNPVLNTGPTVFGWAEIPVYQDILFNEIMFKPEPLQGLPAAEWVEIINRSGKFIQLANLEFSDAGVTKYTLPDFVLPPDSMLVLCHPNSLPLLQATTSNVLALSGFPSLNDDEETVNLTLPNNSAAIDRIRYTAAWHTDSDKSGGGWSLERINPDLPCLGKENWRSCPLPAGGTPGRRNAAYDPAGDLTAPRVLRVFPLNASQIQLYFTEGLDASALLDPGVFQFQPALSVASAGFVDNDQAFVLLNLSTPMLSQTVYTLSFGPELIDCSGNSIDAADTVRLGVPEQPEWQDLVINEILFNPMPDGGRYVEIYNRSNKIFDLTDFTLANYARPTTLPQKIGIERQFLPGEYLVFTPKPLDVAARFAHVRPDWLLFQDLPSLTDRSDNVTLFWSENGQKIVVDSLNYTAEWHNALLTSSEQEGVALERIRAEGFTNDAANWTSAAKPAQGAAGTPTQPNSQRFQGNFDNADQLIQLPLARLSPDDDGFEDFLAIQYLLPGPGYFATFTIYDAEGIPVKKLLRQELIGTEGLLRWDGDADDGIRVRPGIYILYAEVFEPGGNVKRQKKLVSVVARF